jgi:hypothetical protein
MNANNIETIAKKINTLTNNNTLIYLQEKSTWFSENFVSMENKNKYPYLNYEYEDFFFDNRIQKLDKEAGLKFIVSLGLNDDTKDKELISKWIIKTWGGIKGIKDSTIKDIVNNIDKKEYSFNNISSWSKVHSFKNIDTDVIYDSKVIYSLNWLLLQLDSDNLYFLQPEGRNKRLTAFPINAIINFKYSNLIDMNKRGSKATNKVYLDENEVYTMYRQFVSILNKKLWNEEYIDLTNLIGKKIYLKDYPFFTELLLFNMADDVIVNDVRKNVSITLD